MTQVEERERGRGREGQNAHTLAFAYPAFADLHNCGGRKRWRDSGCASQWLHIPTTGGRGWKIQKNNRKMRWCEGAVRTRPTSFSMRPPNLLFQHAPCCILNFEFWIWRGGGNGDDYQKVKKTYMYQMQDTPQAFSVYPWIKGSNHLCIRLQVSISGSLTPLASEWLMFTVWPSVLFSYFSVWKYACLSL